MVQKQQKCKCYKIFTITYLHVGYKRDHHPILPTLFRFQIFQNEKKKNIQWDELNSSLVIAYKTIRLEQRSKEIAQNAAEPERENMKKRLKDKEDKIRRSGPGFPNVGTTGALCWIIPSCKVRPAHCTVFGSTCGLHP